MRSSVDVSFGSKGDLQTMPDSRRPPAPVSLSASEARLVASSHDAALAGATAGELRKKIARVRALRDKWRDVYTTQRRQAQQARVSRASAANRRSRDKAELFGAVLARLEGRLEEVAASGAAAGPRPKTRPSPRKRTQQHRRERSRTKRTLAEEVAERASTAQRSARADLPPMQARTPPRKEKKVRRAAKKTAGQRSAKKSPAARRPPREAKTKARDQSRSAAARHRTKASGLTTRVRGHVSARGKRAQARRDRR
jgi:hypothetical protein